jgi:hypothetical protein
MLFPVSSLGFALLIQMKELSDRPNATIINE